MSERPFMQLYVSDFIGDTLHLSTEQIGAYMLLLMAMWNAGGKLPSDEAKLARVARLSVKKWKSIADDLMSFFEVDGTEIRHHRLTKELQKSESKSQSRAAAGAAGGNAKALKDKQAHLANAMPEPQHLPDTIHMSSSLRSEDSAPAPSKAKPKSNPDLEAFKAELSMILDDNRIEGLCKVRRKKGGVFSATAGRLLVDALRSCPDVLAAADEMLLRNWIGIKPEWMAGRQSHAPPSAPRMTAYQQRAADAKAEIEKFLNPDKRHDPEPPGHTATLDLEPGDFRFERPAGFGTR